MPVEVLTGTVIPHGGAGVGMPGSDLDVPQVNSGVEHRGYEGVPKHVRMHVYLRQSGLLCESLQSSGSTVAVHTVVRAIPKDRPTGPSVDGAVDGSADGRWKRCKRVLLALAPHPQNRMAVDLIE